MTGFGAGLLVFGLQMPTVAAAPPPMPGGGGDATCDIWAGTCDVSVVIPPSRGGSGAGRADPVRNGSGRGGQDAPPRISDLCETKLAKPQPPKSDQVWGGHTTGAIYEEQCPFTKDAGPTTVALWLPGPPADTPTVSPIQLARQALASLTIPKPALSRSPTEANSDNGVPYTWVNLWTWYWTSPESWRVLSKTASLGTVSATVRVTPTELVFNPGDGEAAVSCDGPGRPWTEEDGNDAPSAGGCGYPYRSVTDRVSPTVSIRWRVAWTGSGGAGGTLPDMTTQSAPPPFKVEQIQTVNR